MSAEMQSFIAGQAQRYPEIRRIVLFGSRAKGTAGSRSDYDLAVDSDAVPRERWARFSVDFQESAPTLCRIDLVWLQDPLTDELRRQIETQGAVIYERSV